MTISKLGFLRYEGGIAEVVVECKDEVLAFFLSLSFSNSLPYLFNILEFIMVLLF